MDTARFSKIQQLYCICECPTYLTGYSKSNFPHRLPKGINKLVRNGETIRFKWLSRNEAHIFGWILVVSSLLTWHQWMKQPTIAKKQIKGSHVAEQWLMRLMATVAPRTTGMTNNTIKKHLVLHLCEDILNHGVPDNVNSAYPESARIPLAKITSRNTQKRAVSFTTQAAHRFVENLVVSLASAGFNPR